MGVPAIGMLLFFAVPVDCSIVPAQESAYEESYRACPGNTVLASAYSSLLIRQGQFARALEVASGNPALLLNRGIALYSLRRTRESLDALEHLDSPKSYFYRGLNYRLLARHTEARSCLLKAWNAGYHDPFLLYTLIEEDHAVADKQAGIAHFGWMLEQYPESAWTHMVLGNAAFALEKDQEARAEYAKALALNPKLANVNYRLGFLAYQAGDDDTAERYFRDELKIQPEHSDSWLFLGEALKRRGKTREAIPYLRHALALDPASGLGYGALATALTETNQLPEAVSVLEQAEKHFPEEASFPGQLARLYALLDRKADAEREAQRARSLLALKLQKQDIPAKP